MGLSNIPDHKTARLSPALSSLGRKRRIPAPGVVVLSSKPTAVALEEAEELNPVANVLHRSPLGELCHSTPAVALGRMFIRTEKHLWSFGGAKKLLAK